MFEYIAPVFELSIGKYQYKRVKSSDFYSSRVNPVDHLTIEIDPAEVPVRNIVKGQPVEFWQGYRNHGIWLLLTGLVIDVSYQNPVIVYCKSDMVKLRELRITKSFVNVRPQEIIRFVLAEAGIRQVNLSAQPIPAKHSFVSASKNGIELIKLINRSWRLDDWEFYMEPGGEFYWGPWEESKRFQQQEIVTFEYGQNIINLNPSDEETGALETIALPFLKHSEIIRIKDNRFWARDVTARVENIRHRLGEKARTYIEWRILAK